MACYFEQPDCAAQHDPEPHFFVAHPESATKAKTAARVRVRAFFIPMRVTPFLIVSSAIFLVAGLVGCASRSPRSTAVEDYTAFLRTHPGADLDPAEERAAVQRFEEFLASFTVEKVQRDTAAVYAPEAFFNDTLKTVCGPAAIEKHFLGAIANTTEITVEFTGRARSGNDYYFRWVMDVRYRLFHGGKTVRTIGMSHIRFDRDGRVILHQDYWDATQGFFEYVPVIGPGIRWIKSRI
jgi:hypothetical protein